MDNLQPGTAPKVTPADIEAEIAVERYFTAADGTFGADMRVDGTSQPPDDGTPLSLLTFCVLILRNGFTVTGESACASPENFDAEVGRKVARAAAVAKCWPLMGFALRNEITGRRPMSTGWAEREAEIADAMGATVHYPRDTSDLKAPAGMEIVSTEVINNPNDFGYLLRVHAKVGDENRIVTEAFHMGITPEATTKAKRAAHAKCIATLEAAFGIKR